MFEIAVFATLLVTSDPAPSPAPALAETDRVRIVEAFRLADTIGDRIWPDWSKAPFAILLITSDYEFLIRHDRPSDDFTALGDKESIAGHKVFFRARTFDPKLLATFPAVGGVSTIVVGQAENTSAKTSTPWVVTLMHEHFHQLQNSQPGYYADVEALGLARGDQSGMWMLNYEFPYATPEVKNQFAVMCQALADALRESGPEKTAAFLDARKKFQSLVSVDDAKYFAFQTWQEGIARYTEFRVAALAATDYQPSPEFKALADFTPFDVTARAILDAIDKELASPRLDEEKRVAFYALGASEGLLLDRVNREWRARYFQEKFSLDGLFQPRE